MTDLPAADARPAGRRRCCPTLMTPCARSRPTRAPPARRCGGCSTARSSSRVLMRYPDRVTMCVSSQAGCGMACPFCATGQGGLHPQHVDRRDRRPGRRRRPGAGARRGRPAARAGSPTSSSWAWASRWPTTRRSSAPSAGSPTRPPTASGMSARGITVSTVGLVPAMRPARRRGPPGHARAVAARARRRAARRAGPGQHPLEGRRGPRGGLELRARRPSAGSRIEYALIRDINDQAWRADLLGDVLTSYGDGAGCTST